MFYETDYFISWEIKCREEHNIKQPLRELCCVSIWQSKIFFKKRHKAHLKTDSFIYIDNPGIDDFAGSENAIARIENECNNSGFFIIVFVLFLQEGGIHDSDVHVTKSLLDSIANSLRKLMTNKYGATVTDIIVALYTFTQERILSFRA